MIGQATRRADATALYAMTRNGENVAKRIGLLPKLQGYRRRGQGEVWRYGLHINVKVYSIYTVERS